MHKGHSEIRIIWLMLLMIATMTLWYFDLKLLSVVLMIAMTSSVVHYVADLARTSEQTAASLLQIQTRSKIPLYIASLLAAVGGLMSWLWLVALGISLWLFLFLNWLRQLERQQQQLAMQLAQIQQHKKLQGQSYVAPVAYQQTSSHPALNLQDAQLTLLDQLKQWLFQGNPVLKAGIVTVLIGVILLLRFATEHWQMNLAAQLIGLSVFSAAVVALGYRLSLNSRGFGLGLQGLGFAGLFLSLFFAHYNLIIADVMLASLFFCGIMAIAIYFSWRQSAVELALMAMLIAYIAPFSLPEREMSSTALVGYYAVINVGAAILSSIRPWKILNQIALICTLLIASSYVIYQDDYVQWQLLLLILLNAAIFIWVGFRYSQLLARVDLQGFKLKPVLDLALIFSVPLLAYALIYALYFQQNQIQAWMSLAFAVLYAVLAFYVRRLSDIAIIAQSYLSLSIIFLCFIPTILLPVQWVAIGWAALGLLAFILAMLRPSVLAQYLSIGLLTVAGISGFYELIDATALPRRVLWSLVLSYLTVVLVANSRQGFRQQCQDSTVVFQACIFAIAVALALYLLQLDLKQGDTFALLCVSAALFVINRLMQVLKAQRAWLLAKLMGVALILIYAFVIWIDHFSHGGIDWPTMPERIYYSLACLFIFGLSSNLSIDRLAATTTISSSTWGMDIGHELQAAIALFSLALASSGLYVSMPWISMSILPLALAAYTYLLGHKSVPKSTLDTFHPLIALWQTKISVLLVALWAIGSQLFESNVFVGYVLPILNPFDLLSLMVLVLYMCLLRLQLKQGVDPGLITVLTVSAILWLSSYILSRALHFYFDRPYNDLNIWSDMMLQMGLSLVWVSLALGIMTVAKIKANRYLWIIGASFLCIVVLKLVLIDLSHVGTLMRVFSFLGAGAIMLLIAYIAPIPEKAEAVTQTDRN